MFQPIPPADVELSCHPSPDGTYRWRGEHLSTGVSVRIDRGGKDPLGMMQERLQVALARELRRESSGSVLAPVAYVAEKSNWPGWWPFLEEPCPSASELANVRPLAPTAARTVWRQLIGVGRHPMTLHPQDWPSQVKWTHSWPVDGGESEWLAAELDLPDEALVYFLAGSSTVVEATWQIFRDHVSCFELLDDEGPFVVAPGHATVLTILPTSGFGVARRRIETEFSLPIGNSHR